MRLTLNLPIVIVTLLIAGCVDAVYNREFRVEPISVTSNGAETVAATIAPYLEAQGFAAERTGETDFKWGKTGYPVVDLVHGSNNMSRVVVWTGMCSPREAKRAHKFTEELVRHIQKDHLFRMIPEQ